MKRLAFQIVREWRNNPHRKPLVLRGARQVGKTFLARQAGAELFINMVEINFEFSPEMAVIFQKNLDPERIVRELELFTGQTITPGETLLFLDEIQYEPQALLALRYFYEKMPTLHVIAAGSLLEFAIETVGIPVGRLNFLWLRPLSFIEFLMANQLPKLAEEILQHPITEEMSTPIHEKLLQHLSEYMCVGGMPESVLTWSKNKNLQECQLILDDIITSYQQDFEKFSKKHQIKFIDLLFKNIPLQLSQPFFYSKVSNDYRKRELSPCVDLLKKAGIIHQVYRSAANGIPLGATADLEKFKLIFIDVALTQQILGLKTQDWILNPAQSFINKGALVESLVGQEMLAYSSVRQDAQLYYWQNNKRNSEAEVDYVIQHNTDIIPIEVKSGKGTTLQSMHVFLKQHSTPYGIRFSTHNYSQHEKILSYPLYAIAHALETLSP